MRNSINRSDKQHSFAKIAEVNVQRSVFNRSCGLKTTFDGAGKLIPIFVDEALPGDTMNLTMHNFCRMGTPLHPTMDNMTLDSFFFAVPVRLLWDNWQKFNGEQLTPGDSIDFLVPQMPETNIAEGTVSDYFGLPTQLGNEISFNVLHHRAYNLIWNEWFRDQNMQNPAPISTDDGPDDPADYTIRKRGKRHDYFTSCLPWAQKGAAINLPLGTSAPVVGQGDSIPVFLVDGDLRKLESAGGGTGLNLSASVSGSDELAWSDTALEADLSSAVGTTINALRQAVQLQKILERDARGGTRYTEIIRSHFGVTSDDARLQRPEYLGGGSQSITIQTVPQTSSTDATTPQGNLAGYGTSGSSNHKFTKSFTEHCVIVGLLCVRADMSYQQGLDRMFSRRTRYDFALPSLAHIGEQAVLNKEIYAQGDANDDLVFGYQERFAEYRYKASKITGEMRSNAANSLDTWHLAQDFSSLPLLDNNFIKENPPLHRTLALVNEAHFIFDAFFEFRHARALPTFGTPGNLDRF